MYPNIQAYDRGVMFSPDGRLFQVEYAREAVRRGATSLGMITDTGVLLVAHKNILDPLIVPSTIQKIFKVDSFIGMAYSGMVSDGLHVVNILRQKTQTHRMVYDETQSIETVSRDIAEEMQLATQYGGIRPYAISMLIGGVDPHKRLFEVEPGATLSGYKADAIGQGKKVATDILLKDYKDDIPMEDGISLAVDIIKKVSERKVEPTDMEISHISKKRGFENITQISKYF
ncbi:MAG: archaeal proteasome endopeptidase complex subunit alpha [Candidatus Marsarchaeota archaeon]|jgi:proteasome alpha subunit|nr:archaeal proteasome endopeptidase complex subunit alpha [Candidatus Marsarchaeota archaeon]